MMALTGAWSNPSANFKDIVCDVESTSLKQRVERHEEIVMVALEGETHIGTVEQILFRIDRFSQYSNSQEQELAWILNQTVFNPGFGGRFIFHNLLFDLPLLMRRFRPVPRFREHLDLCPRLWDTLALSRLLKSNKINDHADVYKRSPHGLKFLVEEYLKQMHTSFDAATDGVNIRFSNQDKLRRYNLEDCSNTRLLNQQLEQELKKHHGQEKYFVEIEMPHIVNIFHLNYHGVPFHKKRALKYLDKIERDVENLSRDIFSVTGRVFSLSSQDELTRALFYNPKVTYFDPITLENRVIRPLYVTPNNHKPKTDLDSLSELRDELSALAHGSVIAELLGKVIKALELLRARSNIELLLNHAELGTPGDIHNGGWRIYQNNAVEATSGRTVGKRPNLLGLPKKVFKHIDPKLLKHFEKKWSVRSLIRTSNNSKISGEDINALDIVVIADGASQFNSASPWLTYVGKHDGCVIDPHLAVLQDLYPDRYTNEALADLPSQTALREPLHSYWMLKPGKNALTFVHKDPSRLGGRVEVLPLDNPQDFLDRLEVLRKTYKQLNLATPYLLGAVNLALKLRDADGKDWPALEAQQLLDAFYEKYPEIRDFQDFVAEAVYHDGFLQCMFGRVFYPQCWDNLNEYYRKADRKAGIGEYEFIIQRDSRYWHLKFEGWEKDDVSSPIVKNMRTVDRKFGLRFKRLISTTQLPQHLFQKSGKKKPGKFQRKTEQNLEEASDLALTRIQITNEVDKTLHHGQSWTDAAAELRASLIDDGQFLLPERGILFYRVSLRDPASKYFRQYRPLIRAAKKFFPLYCQGVAATVARLCFTHARKRIEQESNTAIILFYIHDQLDVMHLPAEKDLMKAILDEAIQSPKTPFGLEFSGQFEEKGRSFK